MSDCKIEITGSLDPDQLMVVYFAETVLMHYKPATFPEFHSCVETLIEMAENVVWQRAPDEETTP